MRMILTKVWLPNERQFVPIFFLLFVKRCDILLKSNGVPFHSQILKTLKKIIKEKNRSSYLSHQFSY